ncbi:alpha/beta fold hydrolase [Shewanella sp. TC10]|uniref:alpha/beta fold hydrolase n=1 Tax=Shewanella sp. TC10 TaxID=1419739 RepID=UPI001E2E01BD|nr:alpha/beta fold hydrolase [Shewanella sp. TC10]
MLFSSEDQLNNDEQQGFWQSVTQSTLEKDNVSLAYAYIKHADNSKAIVISSGRVESYLKYKELMFDLYQHGYSLYIIDHRGQGLSSRMTDNPHQGHIDNFQTYIDDLNDFIEKVVKPKSHKDLYLVGHSMGGTIGTLYMEQFPATFNAAVFSAPMYGIKLPFKKTFIRSLASLLDTCTDKQPNKQPNYVLGGTDYEPVEFTKNHLTSSKARYQQILDVFQQNPHIQLGSPTNHWLIEAMDAADRAIKAAALSIKPIMVLQAMDDAIVDNAAQNRAENERCQIRRINNCQHEVFIEADEARNHALRTLITFLEQH